MRKIALLSVLFLSASTALAWIPKLDDTTTKNVIDAAYGRRDPLTTYISADLSVQDGKFGSDGAVKAFDGGDACISDWLANPAAYDTSGSRPVSLTFSGQADQLSFVAAAARDSFKTLTAANALKAFGAGVLPEASNEFGAKVGLVQPAATAPTKTAATTPAATPPPIPQAASPSVPDGQLRLDLVVAGLADQKQRVAYRVRVKGPDGKLVAPVKSSYVNDWKADSAGRFTGTLVYYFEPQKANINANDKVDVLISTEAESTCVYAINFDLGKFY